MWSPEVPSSVFRTLLYWRLLCLSSCFVDPHPDSGRVGRRYEDLGRLGRGFRAPTFILPLAALPPSSWSAAFALLERRAGSRRASHPSPPPSGHQSTNLPASKRALKALQRMLTTLNGHYVRLGSQSSPVGASPPPFRPDLWINRVGAPITPTVRGSGPFVFSNEIPIDIKSARALVVRT